MIQSFANKDTEAIWNRRRVRKLQSIDRIAYRKLIQLDKAKDLNDMAIPPRNRLKRLTGNRKGQCSIRINDQYRICFTWHPTGPHDVEIVDYH